MKYARRQCQNCMYWRTVVQALREENERLQWTLLEMGRTVDSLIEGDPRGPAIVVAIKKEGEPNQETPPDS